MTSTSTEKEVKIKTYRNIVSPKEWDKHNISFFKSPLKPQETKRGRVIQIKPNFDFRFGIDAMMQELKKDACDFEKLKRGNYVVFLNHDQNRVRMLTIDRFGDPVIAVKTMPKGRFLDLRVVSYLPQAFNGREIDVDQATEQALNDFFGRHKRKNPNVLREDL